MRTTTFGDRARFAIDCRINDTSGNHVFGNICLWISEQQVGIFERQALLTRVVYLFRESIKSRTKRTNEDLCRQDAIVVFNKVFNAMYGELEDDDSRTEILQEGINYRPFLILDHWEDNFDDCLAVIVECPTKQRFLWKSWKDVKANFINEAALKNGEYESVATAFVEWFIRETGIQYEVGIL